MKRIYRFIWVVENYEELFFQAKNALEKNTCIRLVDRTSEEDFIEIVGQDGCWSYLGKRGGKQQVRYAGTSLLHIYDNTQSALRNGYYFFQVIAWDWMQSNGNCIT